MDFWQWSQFVLTFALVVTMAYFATRFLGQRGFTGRNKDMRVFSSTSLGGRRYLTLVQVREHTYLLGVTDHSITLISKLDGEPEPTSAQQQGEQSEQ